MKTVSREFGPQDLFVSMDGNDSWSGAYENPQENGSDGPLATIEGARNKIRSLKVKGLLAGPVNVWIREGLYKISETIVLDEKDSAPVTYRAYPTENPVLDGGRRIIGWYIEEVNGRQVWSAEIPEVKSGRWYFRQLFVNGNRRERTRLPKKGFYQMKDVPDIDYKTARLFEGSRRFQCNPGDICDWVNLQDVEIIVPHYWTVERMPIASFDPDTGMVVSSKQSIFSLRDGFAWRYAFYFAENVFEALSEPGEWYLDRSKGKVYYIPMPGEELNQVEIVAPVVEQIIRIKGKPEQGQYVEFVKFKDLTFRYTEWSHPENYWDTLPHKKLDSRIEYAAEPQSACNVKGAIYFYGARYCGMENCTLEHMGGYGIDISYGCSGIRVANCVIRDMGAGGIKLNGSYETGKESTRTGSNYICDNHIHNGGSVFMNGVGILSMHSFNNTFSHNHIHDFYTTGISCGWVWGYDENISKNNKIEKNIIHDLGKGVLSDMGAIYTLGVQPGTVIRGNYIYNIHAGNYGGWGIYTDEGSSYMVIENNIVFNTSHQGFNQHFGKENIVRNNIFALCGQGIAQNGRGGGENQFVFMHNIVLTDGQPIFIGGYAGNLENKNFISDANIIWDILNKQPISGNGMIGEVDGKKQLVLNRAFTMDEWNSIGNDLNSKIEDPGFIDAVNFNFNLREDSPAFKVGFKAIDFSDIGPRKE